jgi:hypothetical protein
MTKKKKFIAAALVIWILGAIYLASKSYDEIISGKHLSGNDEALSLKRIMFPSRMMQEQE